jgi:hypothetical protein
LLIKYDVFQKGLLLLFYGQHSNQTPQLRPRQPLFLIFTGRKEFMRGGQNILRDSKELMRGRKQSLRGGKKSLRPRKNILGGRQNILRPLKRTKPDDNHTVSPFLHR